MLRVAGAEGRDSVWRRSRTTTRRTPRRRRDAGPLGDSVLALFPESVCPHLSEIVLGFEPWFEVELLRADGGDFARTFRHWQLRLRAHEAAAAEATDPATVRRFRRYIAASEVQFRSGVLTNYRIVLRRRRRRAR